MERTAYRSTIPRTAPPGTMERTRWNDGAFPCPEAYRSTAEKQGAMNLQEAADILQITKKRLWRAVKAGKVPAERVDIGGKWEYQVTLEDVEAYRSTLATERDTEPMERDTGAHHQDTERSPNRSTIPPAGTHPGPPVEVYAMMLDRLQRAERRAVELELTLQQQQRLLCENAESITEREARARQAEAVAADRLHREQELAEEVARLKDALEATRKPQKRSGLLGWLGFRRADSSPADANKSA